MTARNQPHKYRCETCTHDKTKERPDDSIRRILEFQGAIYCEVAGHWLYPNGEGSNYMELVGCASHSDAIKAEQRIADVIAELERRKGRLGTYPDNVQAIRTYESVIALLRKKGE